MLESIHLNPFTDTCLVLRCRVYFKNPHTNGQSFDAGQIKQFRSSFAKYSKIAAPYRELQEHESPAVFEELGMKVNMTGEQMMVLADNDAKSGLAGSTLNVVTAAQKIGDSDIHYLATTKAAAAETSKLGKTYLCEGAKTADVM